MAPQHGDGRKQRKRDGKQPGARVHSRPLFLRCFFPTLGAPPPVNRKTMESTADAHAHVTTSATTVTPGALNGVIAPRGSAAERRKARQVELNKEAALAMLRGPSQIPVSSPVQLSPAVTQTKRQPAAGLATLPEVIKQPTTNCAVLELAETESSSSSEGSTPKQLSSKTANEC